jgi:hypothetical protein
MLLTPVRKSLLCSIHFIKSTYPIYRVSSGVGSDRRGDFSTGEPYLKICSSSHKFATGQRLLLNQSIHIYIRTFFKYVWVTDLKVSMMLSTTKQTYIAKKYLFKLLAFWQNRISYIGYSTESK